MINFFKYLIVVVIAFAAMVESAPAYAAPSACEMIKGKTYVFFLAGGFNGNPDTVGSGKLTIDSVTTGAPGTISGTERSFLAIAPPTNPSPTSITLGTATGNAQDQIRKVDCTTDPHNPLNMGRPTGHLNFTSSGGDAGSMRFTVYDGGARLWGECLSCGAPPTLPLTVVSGWYVLLPPPPPTA